MAIDSNERRARKSPKKSTKKPANAKSTPRKSTKKTTDTQTVSDAKTRGRPRLPQNQPTKSTSGRQLVSGSGVDRGLRSLARETGDTWTYDSKTRGAVNDRTGQRLSRRQFDKRAGLLAQQGYTGYENKRAKRAAAGLQGFKRLPHYPKLLYKNYKSRDEMLLALIELSDKTDYTYRVRGTGEPADSDKYTPNGRGEVTIYTNDLAGRDADDLFDRYDPRIYEKNFKHVRVYTIVASPNYVTKDE